MDYDALTAAAAAAYLPRLQVPEAEWAEFWAQLTLRARKLSTKVRSRTVLVAAVACNVAYGCDPYV